MYGFRLQWKRHNRTPQLNEIFCLYTEARLAVKCTNWIRRIPVAGFRCRVSASIVCLNCTQLCGIHSVDSGYESSFFSKSFWPSFGTRRTWAESAAETNIVGMLVGMYEHLYRFGNTLCVYQTILIKTRTLNRKKEEKILYVMCPNLVIYCLPLWIGQREGLAERHLTSIRTASGQHQGNIRSSPAVANVLSFS